MDFPLNMMVRAKSKCNGNRPYSQMRGLLSSTKRGNRGELLERTVVTNRKCKGRESPGENSSSSTEVTFPQGNSAWEDRDNPDSLGATKTREPNHK